MVLEVPQWQTGAGKGSLSLSLTPRASPGENMLDWLIPPRSGTVQTRRSSGPPALAVGGRNYIATLPIVL